MESQRSRWLKLALIVMMIGLLGGVAQQPVGVSEAQGNGMLTYGSSVHGIVSAAAPLVFYSFNGAEGDLVHLDVMGLTGGFDPVVDLLAPDRQTIASSQRNSLAVDTRDAHIELILSQTGMYSIILGGVNGTVGDFLLELNGRSRVMAVSLVFGQTMDVNIVQNAPQQYFTFEATECPTALFVLNPSQGQPFTFPFIVKVRDSLGQDVAILRGGEALRDRVTVEPLSGIYEVEVWSEDPNLAGMLSLLVSCGSDAPACLSSPGSAGGPGAAGGCPDCPPCEDDLAEDPALCADFAIAVDAAEDYLVTISWPAVEGADAAIVSARNEDGDVVYGRLVNDVLTETIDFDFWGGGPGTYLITVSVGTEGPGYHMCADRIFVEVEGTGPVDWGPPVDEECTVEIVAPLDTIANGLQTIFWTDVPGAESYWLRVYGQYDAVVAEGSISAPSTSMTLDLSEAAIGAGYGGENDFYLQLDVMRGGERWCVTGTRVTRNP